MEQIDFPDYVYKGKPYNVTFVVKDNDRLLIPKNPDRTYNGKDVKIFAKAIKSNQPPKLNKHTGKMEQSIVGVYHPISFFLVTSEMQKKLLDNNTTKRKKTLKIKTAEQNITAERLKKSMIATKIEGMNIGDNATAIKQKYDNFLADLK